MSEWIVLCLAGLPRRVRGASHDLGLRRATDVIGGYQALEQDGVLGSWSCCYAAALFSTELCQAVDRTGSCCHRERCD